MLDLSKGPVKLISPALKVPTLDIASVRLAIDIGQSEDTTCQLEWLVAPGDEIRRNPKALIPRYKETEHATTPLSAPAFREKSDAARVQTDSVSVDLGSRVDWVFERRTVSQIAVKFTGSGQVRISAITLKPPAPTGGLGLKPIIQFHER